MVSADFPVFHPTYLRVDQFRQSVCLQNFCFLSLAQALPNVPPEDRNWEKGKRPFALPSHFHPLTICNLLLTTYCSLFITYYLVHTVYNVLPIFYYLRLTTCYSLPLPYYLLLTTYYVIFTTYYVMFITYYLLPTTQYSLLIRSCCYCSCLFHYCSWCCFSSAF